MIRLCVSISEQLQNGEILPIDELAAAVMERGKFTPDHFWGHEGETDKARRLDDCPELAKALVSRALRTVHSRIVRSSNARAEARGSQPTLTDRELLAQLERVSHFTPRPENYLIPLLTAAVCQIDDPGRALDHYQDAAGMPCPQGEAGCIRNNMGVLKARLGIPGAEYDFLAVMQGPGLPIANEPRALACRNLAQLLAHLIEAGCDLASLSELLHELMKQIGVGGGPVGSDVSMAAADPLRGLIAHFDAQAAARRHTAATDPAAENEDLHLLRSILNETLMPIRSGEVALLYGLKPSEARGTFLTLAARLEDINNLMKGGRFAESERLAEELAARAGSHPDVRRDVNRQSLLQELRAFKSQAAAGVTEARCRAMARSPEPMEEERVIGDMEPEVRVLIKDGKLGEASTLQRVLGARHGAQSDEEVEWRARRARLLHLRRLEAAADQQAAASQLETSQTQYRGLRRLASDMQELQVAARARAKLFDLQIAALDEEVRRAADLAAWEQVCKRVEAQVAGAREAEWSPRDQARLSDLAARVRSRWAEAMLQRVLAMRDDSPLSGIQEAIIALKAELDARGMLDDAWKARVADVQASCERAAMAHQLPGIAVQLATTPNAASDEHALADLARLFSELAGPQQKRDLLQRVAERVAEAFNGGLGGDEAKLRRKQTLLEIRNISQQHAIALNYGAFGAAGGAFAPSPTAATPAPGASKQPDGFEQARLGNLAAAAARFAAGVNAADASPIDRTFARIGLGICATPAVGALRKRWRLRKFRQILRAWEDCGRPEREAQREPFAVRFDQLTALYRSVIGPTENPFRAPANQRDADPSGDSQPA